MKKLLCSLLLLGCSVAQAQFSPGQLLTAGALNSQFALYAPLAGANFSGIVTAAAISGTPISGSSGSFTTLTASSTVTLPAGSIPLSELATQAANTILANGTGSTASPTAISVPSCSTSSSGLQWTSGTGFACNTSINAATLGGATFASPSAIGTTTPAAGKFTTLQATSTITPSSTAGIVGTTTNDNANAGSIGEHTSNTSSTVSLTSNIGVTTASLTLSAGDWDVQAVIAYAPAGSTIMGTGWAGVSTTTNTFGAYNSYTQTTHLNNSAGQGEVVTSPVVRISVASSTAVYAIAQSFFTTSTETAKGFIRARRVH